MQNKPNLGKLKQKEWWIEICDSLFGELYTTTFTVTGVSIEKKLKSYSRYLLSHRDKELIEKIEKMKRNNYPMDLWSELRIEDIKQTGKSSLDCNAGYNQALTDIINLIKQR